MQRHIININGYKYLIEYNNSIYEKSTIYTASKYVMLRNFSVVNDVITDTDILFIDKESFKEIIEELKSNDLSNIQVFPISESKNSGYSKNFAEFNSNLYKEHFLEAFDENDEVNKDNQYIYSLYEKKPNGEFSEKFITNNILKLYHPITQTSINGIICIKNIINNINIYYLCKKYSQYETKSETEITVENNRYSEYIEIPLPNIEDLFGVDKVQEGDETINKYSTYYIENLNILAHDTLDKDTNVELIRDIIVADAQYVPLNLIIQPFKIKEAWVDEYNNIIFNHEDKNEFFNYDKIYIKDYVNIKKTIDNNYLTFPFTFMIYPYSEMEDINQYQLAENSSIANKQITTESKIMLSSRLGFNNGHIALINRFIYPESNKYDNIKDAYLQLNNVKIEEYDDFYGDTLDVKLNNISYNDISELELDVVKNLLKMEGIHIDRNSILKKYRELLKEQILEDYDEDYGVDTNFIGFRIEISADNNFKTLIYNKEIYCKLNDLADFSFEINGIIDDWSHRPDRLLCRTIFIDRYLGKSIISNFVIITKEWFKYIINNDYNISSLYELNNANKEYDIMLNKEQKEIVLNKDNVNFINSIKCIVSKKIDNTNNGKVSNTPRIIFKPIFYKVQNLQNIQIRQTVKQNIGINLSEYMTKVETFKLLIDNIEVVESARNDMYVIFSIDGKKISSYSGKYDIVNQDDEYISSGNWILV